jgi:hypothetical protein
MNPRPTSQARIQKRKVGLVLSQIPECEGPGAPPFSVVDEGGEEQPQILRSPERPQDDRAEVSGSSCYPTLAAKKKARQGWGTPFSVEDEGRGKQKQVPRLRLPHDRAAITGPQARSARDDTVELSAQDDIVRFMFSNPRSTNARDLGHPIGGVN